MHSGRACLYPGRFQPLHNGHAAVISRLLERYDRIVVAISLAHISHTFTDPFTGGERFEMIRAFAMEAALRDRIDIVSVPTEVYPTTWAPLIQAISPRFEAVYARNPFIRAVCSYWGYQLDKTEVDRFASATRIREAMVRGGDWRSMIPAPVADLILGIDGVERVKLLALGENY